MIAEKNISDTGTTATAADAGTDSNGIGAAREDVMVMEMEDWGE